MEVKYSIFQKVDSQNKLMKYIKVLVNIPFSELRAEFHIISF